MQGTWARSLVWEDPQAVKQLSPWATQNYWDNKPGPCALQQEKPWQSETHAQQLESSHGLPQLEKAHMQHQRLSAAKKKNNEGEKRRGRCSSRYQAIIFQ